MTLFVPSPFANTRPGLKRNTLDAISAEELEFLIKLHIAQAKAYVTIHRMPEGVVAYQDTLTVSSDKLTLLDYESHSYNTLSDTQRGKGWGAFEESLHCLSSFQRLIPCIEVGPHQTR